LSRIDGTQQQHDRKLYAKDLGEKCSYLGLVSIFGRFSSLGYCTFFLSIILTILIGNKNKMTENDVRMGWVQKQVMMWLFVTIETFPAKWLKLLTVICFSRIDGKQEQNDQKLCGKDFGQKRSYLGLVTIFGRFWYVGSCTFVLSIF